MKSPRALGASLREECRSARSSPADRQPSLTLHGQGRARAPERSRGRGVGLVELDVAAPGARTAQGVIRIEFGRIDDDAGLRQADDELIVNARFARVPGLDDPIDVTDQVRPRGAADEAGSGRPAVGIRTRVDLHVRGDAGPVNVQADAVVDVLQMSPGRRAVLASAPDAEVCLGAGAAEDEAAAGQEIALPSSRRAARERERKRRDSKRITTPNSTHCYSSIRMVRSFGLAQKRPQRLAWTAFALPPLRPAVADATPTSATPETIA